MIDEAKRASSMKSLPEQQERLLEAAGGHLEADGKYEILVHLDSSSIMSKIIFKIGQMATTLDGSIGVLERKPINMAGTQAQWSYPLTA